MDVTKELTVVIPVRIDCEERKNNLDTVIYSLLLTTKSNIIILESDVRRKYFFRENKRLNYLFVKSDNPIFHHTLYLNQLLKISKTNIVGMWDTDVIFPKQQIVMGVREVLNGATFCSPFDKCIYLDSEISKCARDEVLSFLKDDSNKELPPVLGRPSVGGAFIINKERYLNAGGENESFYGWGTEDVERYKRMEILEEKISRVSGPLYHLYHSRGVNSTFSDDERSINNYKELFKICKMNKEQLIKHIDTWNKYN